jgi:hypothetical protein
MGRHKHPVPEYINKQGGRRLGEALSAFKEKVRARLIQSGVARFKLNAWRLDDAISSVSREKYPIPIALGLEEFLAYLLTPEAIELAIDNWRHQG